MRSWSPSSHHLDGTMIFPDVPALMLGNCPCAVTWRIACVCGGPEANIQGQS